jgi:hypothetical protein
MTFPFLKLLGHEIAKFKWSENSGRTFWTACRWAFCRYFRESEDSQETLTWKNVLLFESHAIIFMDIFPFDSCPLETIKGLKKVKEKFMVSNLPVFNFRNENFLVQDIFSTTLRHTLRKYIGGRC